jgi:uncharacterized protein (DUF983 family)
MENRAAKYMGEVAENDDEPKPNRPAVIVAKQVFAWRCPMCDLWQFSARSTTHDEKCGRCGREFLIEVRR